LKTSSMVIQNNCNADTESDEKEGEGDGDANDDLGIEKIERGHIQTSVILKYLSAMGGAVVVVIVLSAICMQVGFIMLLNRWLVQCLAVSV
jgi:hypothetical protein